MYHENPHPWVNDAVVTSGFCPDDSRRSTGWMEEVKVLQTFIPANLKSWMEALKHQLLCTDTFGGQFIWYLRLAEMDRTE